MAIEFRDDDELVDPTVHCSNCDAVCCRLTVFVMPEDPVPRAFVDVNEHGMEVMGRGEDGWCVALDQLRMCCSIYELRPDTCRRFTMGSGYCRDERAAYQKHYPGTIPSVLVDDE
ncbi:MAG: YkgJ family cysteine cluster protein [Lysobacterales bacterium]